MTTVNLCLTQFDLTLSILWSAIRPSSYKNQNVGFEDTFIYGHTQSVHISGNASADLNLFRYA